MVQPFHVVADGGVEESQLYYTTSFEKKQAENAGNAREKVIFPADFLPGACRTGGRRHLVWRCERLNYVTTNPRRKLQLEKDLKHYEKAKNYNWSYLRRKYALEHFGEGDEALDMLYKLDTDDKLQWHILNAMDEIKKAGKDPSAIYTKEFFDELNNVK